MQMQIIERIIRQYGLRGAVVWQPQKGYRNASYPIFFKDQPPLNLILYKTESGILARIRRANTVADHAAAKGLPARKTAAKPLIHLNAGTFHKYGGLYTYLPGDTIPWEAYTKDHIKLLGMALGTLHFRLRDLRADLPAVHTEHARLLDSMQAYFNDQGVQKAVQTKLNLSLAERAFPRFKKLLQAAEKLPDQQPLHMDLVRSNVLFGPAGQNTVLRLNQLAVTGILDFEKTARGSRLFDIARTLAFLLVDCKYKPEGKVRKYFLYSGYQKRGESPLPARMNLLDEFVNLFLLHDFYKFLRHNPYESLEQNEHYIRTRDLLLKREVIIT